jgi:mRNA interferase HigB
MHVISKKRLREFWNLYPKSEAPLKAWFKKASKADWEDFHDVKEMFPQTDQYKGLVIFEIGGNKYRLIAEINYDRGKVFVRQMLTHVEYDRGKSKDA